MGLRSGSTRLHHALRDAVDPARDRDDHPTAAALLDELDRHATALDTDTAGTRWRDEVATRRARLIASRPDP